MKDYCLIATAYDNSVRIYVSITTNLVNEARLIHNTKRTATALFGRFLTVSSMIGLMHKGNDRVSLKIAGDGPVGYMLAEANAKGEVKGDIKNGDVYLKKENGKLDCGKAIGNGILQITKDLGLKDFFTSSSSLQTGEIGDDFSYYFTVSEQVPSSVGVGVLVHLDERVLASGGFIIQLLPNANIKIIETIENIISTIKPISTLIHEGNTPEDILSILANKTEHILFKTELKYICHCSKEYYKRSLMALDSKTLDEIILEDGKAEVVCRYCKNKYHYDYDELIDIKNSRK